MQFTKYKIILASNSPRRQELFRLMGIEFQIRLKPVNEDFPTDLQTDDVARYLCEKKAMAFGQTDLNENELLITADTIVCLGNEIMNKPVDREHAIWMLQQLSGKKHQVITGVALRSLEKMISFTDTTDVYFQELTQGQISFYVDTCKPFDKAGAYGIQEWIGFVGIKKIEGSYFNVVGMPTARLFEELNRF
jgi:septum formation protein